MEEIWKDIPGYEGLYQISTCGNVMSLNYNHTGRRKIRIPRMDKGGYLYVNLYNAGHAKTKKIHRLVAEAFLANPNNYPQINHKDECKTNNNVNNLEWCDSSYNNRFGHRIRKSLDAHKLHGSPKAERPVVRLDKDGTIIDEFISISEAARCMGIKRESLRDAVLGRSKTCVGYIWKYKR